MKYLNSDHLILIVEFDGNVRIELIAPILGLVRDDQMQHVLLLEVSMSFSDGPIDLKYRNQPAPVTNRFRISVNALPIDWAIWRKARDKAGYPSAETVSCYASRVRTGRFRCHSATPETTSLALNLPY